MQGGETVTGGWSDRMGRKVNIRRVEMLGAGSRLLLTSCHYKELKGGEEDDEEEQEGKMRLRRC